VEFILLGLFGLILTILIFYGLTLLLLV